MPDFVLSDHSAQGIAELERRIDAALKTYPEDRPDLYVQFTLTLAGLRHLRDAIHIALQVAAAGRTRAS